MKFVRLDRKRRKDGGCVLYYAEHLKAIHRKDLYNDNLEAIWLQVKFPSNSVLFSVMYKPPDACDFYDRIGATLEKTWLKSSNIILLGDLNCDLLNRGSPEIPVNTNAEKLCSVFDLFGMQNVVQEATRTTIISRTLIDLIVTTRKDLISISGAFPLGISDHDLIYANIRLKNKRPPPKHIRTRDYKKIDPEKFRGDVESVPFQLHQFSTTQMTFFGLGRCFLPTSATTTLRGKKFICTIYN